MKVSPSTRLSPQCKGRFGQHIGANTLLWTFYFKAVWDPQGTGTVGVPAPVCAMSRGVVCRCGHCDGLRWCLQSRAGSPLLVLCPGPTRHRVFGLGTPGARERPLPARPPPAGPGLAPRRPRAASPLHIQVCRGRGTGRVLVWFAVAVPTSPPPRGEEPEELRKVLVRVWAASAPCSRGHTALPLPHHVSQRSRRRTVFGTVSHRVPSPWRTEITINLFPREAATSPLRLHLSDDRGELAAVQRVHSCGLSGRHQLCHQDVSPPIPAACPGAVTSVTRTCPHPFPRPVRAPPAPSPGRVSPPAFRTPSLRGLLRPCTRAARPWRPGCSGGPSSLRAAAP